MTATKPMTADEITLFRARMVSALTTADRKEGEREAKRKLRVNIYRIGHYLKAAGEVMEEIEAGTAPADAFAAHFTPTREMHKVAFTLKLPLGVERGRWTNLPDAPEPDTE